MKTQLYKFFRNINFLYYSNNACIIVTPCNLFNMISHYTLLQVQVRPWRISDSDYIMDGSHAIDTRKTIFVGGVPRPLKAIELAEIMNEKYGNVCYAGIDIDTELKYPKGD